MLILQRIKSTFALAFSTILLSSGLVSCGSNGGSGLVPSADHTQSRTIHPMSVETPTPYGSNTCVGSASSRYTCYLAFGGSASINLPANEQLTTGDYNCQGSWLPNWFDGSDLTTMSATFSNKSGNGACKSSVSATVTYHNSLPTSTPESQGGIYAISSPSYDYTYCLNVGGGECSAPSTNAADGWTTVSIYVDAPPTSVSVPNAANAFFGHETCNFFGDGGNGCADSVNFILKQAVGTTFGTRTNYVPSVHAGMLAAGFQPESQSAAQKGDIAIAPNDEHIGICMTAGCTKIDSNSSSRCAFKWQSNGNFDNFYSKMGSTTYLGWGTFQ
jgi:hypothetical protein